MHTQQNQYFAAVSYYDKLSTGKHKPTMKHDFKLFKGVSEEKCQQLFDEAEARWESLNIMYQGQSMHNGLERQTMKLPKGYDFIKAEPFPDTEAGREKHKEFQRLQSRRQTAIAAMTA